MSRTVGHLQKSRRKRHRQPECRLEPKLWSRTHLPLLSEVIYLKPSVLDMLGGHTWGVTWRKRLRTSSKGRMGAQPGTSNKRKRTMCLSETVSVLYTIISSCIHVPANDINFLLCGLKNIPLYMFQLASAVSLTQTQSHLGIGNFN